jgi:cytosine/adenosine deaminase-related metal-dependent hydrolase
MRKIAATYVFTLHTAPLKNGIVVIDTDGTIVEIVDTGGVMSEIEGLEYYTGILCPAFIDVSCSVSGANLGLGQRANIAAACSEGFPQGWISVGNSRLYLQAAVKPKIDYPAFCFAGLNRADDSVKRFLKLHQADLPICFGTVCSQNGKQTPIVESMKNIQAQTVIDTEILLKMACLNGAVALGIDQWAGSIEIGKKPGLNLISAIDWNKLFLTPRSTLKRLV